MEGEEKTVSVDVDEAFIIKSDAGDLCRLCANTDNQLIPIFKGEGIEHNIPTKIEKHLPIIKVTEIDKLPLQICYQCASTLIAWHNLYEGCLIADKRLREILSISEKGFQEDDTFDNYVDDYRDDYDDQSRSNFDTLPLNSAPSTSNLAGDDLLKSNSIEISQLSESKEPNETELDNTDERRQYEKYCVAEEECESTIDRYIYAVDESGGSIVATCEETDSEQNYLCTICGIRMRTSDSLQKHAANAHNERLEQFVCDLCDRTFNSKNKLAGHIRSCHVDITDLIENPIKKLINGKFKCPICNKEFLRKTNANLHFLSHVTEKSLQCEKCQFRCHTQAQLDVHKNKHEKRFCCEICSKMFAYKFQLDVHVQGVHYNLRPFPCNICGKTFKTRYNYGSHMAQHKDIRNFQCPHCPRRCRKSYDLRVHIRTHTGEKPFHCTYCQRSYSQNGDRLKHERHCHQKANITQVLVERYPDNEIIEVIPVKDGI